MGKIRPILIFLILILVVNGMKAKSDSITFRPAIATNIFWGFTGFNYSIQPEVHFKKISLAVGPSINLPNNVWNKFDYVGLRTAFGVMILEGKHFESQVLLNYHFNRFEKQLFTNESYVTQIHEIHLQFGLSYKISDHWKLPAKIGFGSTFQSKNSVVSGETGWNSFLGSNVQLGVKYEF